MSRLKGVDRYLHRLKSLLRDECPTADPLVRAELFERLRGVETFARQQICNISIRNTTHYMLDEHEAHNRPPDFDVLPAHCATHDVIHHYRTADFIRIMDDENAAIMALAANLDPTLPLTPNVKDRIINRTPGIKDAALKAHRYDKTILREIISRRRRAALNDFFYDLDPEEKLDFQLCGRKNAYPTMAAAETTRITEMKNNPKTGTMRIYPCPRCDAYHLGHGKNLKDYTTMPEALVEQLAFRHWRHGTARVYQFAADHGHTEDIRITRGDILAFREQNNAATRHERVF